MISSAIAIFLLNARHIFYGISLIDTYKGFGKKTASRLFAPLGAALGGGALAFGLTPVTASILAESMKKGVEFDLELAYEAARKNATERTMLPWRDGEADELTRCYHEHGFFPGLEEDEEETCDQVHDFENRQSVAVTIELDANGAISSIAIGDDKFAETPGLGGKALDLKMA